VADSNAGADHMQNLFDLFNAIYDKMNVCAQAYGRAVTLPAKPTTLHDLPGAGGALTPGLINTIISFGQSVLTVQDATQGATQMSQANVVLHNDAVRAVLALLDECVREANGFVDYLQKSRDHVAAIVSTFDAVP